MSPASMDLASVHSMSKCEGGGGGGVPGGSGKSKLGTRIENTNWDPRFKLNTELGVKIKKLKMKKIMEKANFDKSACVPCNEAGNERCLTFHVKGSCQTRCRHATDHRKLSDSAVLEMYSYISDGCC